MKLRTLLFIARAGIFAADGFFALSTALVAVGVCRGIPRYSPESATLAALLLMLAFRDWHSARRMARLDRMIDQKTVMLDECHTMLDWYQRREVPR